MSTKLELVDGEVDLEKDPLPALLGILAGAVGMIAMFIQFIPPLGNWFNYEAYSINPNTLPDVGEEVTALYRGLIDEETYLKNMRRLGYNNLYAQMIFGNARTLLNLSDLVTLYWREHIDKDELVRRAGQIGFSEEDVDLYLKRAEFYPSPSDIITWATREVYEPALRAKFMIDRDLPTQVVEAGKKAGMTEEQIKNYWAAHWYLPSMSEIYEMWHRRVIDEEDVDLFFVEQDMAPYWREKLKAISFIPFTRVDVRRMYRVGVLDREGVKQAYLDLGFNDEKAEAMTEFTIKYEAGVSSSGGKDLTRSMIESGYELGMLTRDETKEALMGIGYDENEAEFIVALKEEKILHDHIKVEIDLIVDQIKNGVIDATTAANKLASLGLSEEKIQLTISHALAQAADTVAMPSKADIKSWLKHDVIDEATARKLLSKLRYPEEMINLYIKDWAGAPEREKAARAGGARGGG